MSRAPWWWLRHQPPVPGELNDPDDEHTEHVPTRRDRITGHADDEHVYARPEAATQWDVRLWAPRPPGA